MNATTFSSFSLYLTFLVNKSSMLQIKIVVELERPHLVSLTFSIRKSFSAFTKMKYEIAQSLYISLLFLKQLPLGRRLYENYLVQ